MRKEPNAVEVVIEIPRGSRNKYETDYETGHIFLDRVLHSSVHYPTDYGYVPDTLAPDGDPLDVLVIVEEPTFPGCHTYVRPIGVLVMRDEEGIDEKILSVPVADPRFADVHELGDIGKHWLIEIEHFFFTYKLLENKETEIDGWRDARTARELLASYRLGSVDAASGAAASPTNR